MSTYDASKGFPRVPLDAAIDMMPDAKWWEYAVAGERFLIQKYGGFVWLTEMDHLSVSFYQAYVVGSNMTKAKAGDLLMGLGETLGMSERHLTAKQAEDALNHHEIPLESYARYLGIREVHIMQTSGWGMGCERYLCWLLQHDYVRDFALIPRLKGEKFLP